MRGVLYEAGIHLLDYLMATFGAQPVAVTAVTGSSGEREEETDAVAALTLEFPGGRLAQLLQHRLCPGDTQYFEARVDTSPIFRRQMTPVFFPPPTSRVSR